MIGLIDEQYLRHEDEAQDFTMSKQAPKPNNSEGLNQNASLGKLELPSSLGALRPSLAIASAAIGPTE